MLELGMGNEWKIQRFGNASSPSSSSSIAAAIVIVAVALVLILSGTVVDSYANQMWIDRFSFYVKLVLLSVIHLSVCLSLLESNENRCSDRFHFISRMRLVEWLDRQPDGLVKCRKNVHLILYKLNKFFPKKKKKKIVLGSNTLWHILDFCL